MLGVWVLGGLKRIVYVLLWSHVPQIMMIKQFSQVHTLPLKSLLPLDSVWSKTTLNAGGVGQGGLKQIVYVLLWSHVPQIMMIKQFSQADTLPLKSLLPLTSVWSKTTLYVGGVGAGRAQTDRLCFAMESCSPDYDD